MKMNNKPILTGGTLLEWAISIKDQGTAFKTPLQSFHLARLNCNWRWSKRIAVLELLVVTVCVFDAFAASTPQLQWTLVSPYGIQRDDSGRIWHAGHVTDVLDAGNGALLVGADKGGVWSVSGDGSGTCLSDTFDNPNVLCLAKGPDGPQHFFAGSGEVSGMGALWVTDLRAVDPLTSWLKLPIPDGVGGIARILILPTSRRILIAAQSGLYCSPIPQPSNPLGYSWSHVTSGLPWSYAGYADMLAEGPGESFVVGVPGQGIFYGTCNGQVAAATLNGGTSNPLYGGIQTVTAMTRYGKGVLTAFSGEAVYYSPDGQNLGGGGNTTRVYHGAVGVSAMIAYRNGVYPNGVITAFSDDLIYLSPDGQNLNGGGSSILVYGGTQTVTAMTSYLNGVLTAFSGGGVYFSADGMNVGENAGNTTLRYQGPPYVVAIAESDMACYPPNCARARGVLAAFSTGEIYFSPDGQNLHGGGNSVLVYGGTQMATALAPYQGGVLAAFSGGAVYFSPDGLNLGGGGNTIRVYYQGGSPICLALMPYGCGVIVAFSDGAIYFRPDGRNWATPSVDLTQLDLTSIASCAGNRAVMYAVGRNSSTDNIRAILSSADGGHSWTQLIPMLVDSSVDLRVETAASNQGSYNNCIAVSPINASLVALGWRTGPFVTQDGGLTWRQYSSSEPHLHEDVHAVYFKTGSGTDFPTGQKLYIGTDGGLAGADVMTSSSGTPTLINFTSMYNQHLATLQFYDHGANYGPYGTLSVDDRFLAGGLQDDGTVYSLWRSGGPWRASAGADGGATMILEDTHLVFDSHGDYCCTLPTLATWDGLHMTGQLPVPIRTASGSIVPNDNSGASGRDNRELVMEPVPAPSLHSQYNSAYSILAVAAVTTNLYGLFADNLGPTFMHWETFSPVSLPPSDSSDFITALGSYDGLAVMAGCNSGLIFRLSSGASPVPMTVAGSAGRFSRILMNASYAPALRGYAAAGGGVLKLVNGSTVTPGQGYWINLPAPGSVIDVTVDWETDPPTLYGLTPNSVFLSTNEGSVWSEARAGLPVGLHCSDLRLSGSKLFLSTFGRSVWQASLPGSPPVLNIEVDPRGFNQMDLFWEDCRVVDCCPECPGDPLAPLSYPEVSTSLGPSAKWVPLGNPINESNGLFSMTVNLPENQAFFRLVQRTPLLRAQ
jgi:hypothetical protein